MYIYILPAAFVVCILYRYNKRSDRWGDGGLGSEGDGGLGSEGPKAAHVHACIHTEGNSYTCMHTYMHAGLGSEGAKAAHTLSLSLS
jgi:hypothetical protein